MGVRAPSDLRLPDQDGTSPRGAGSPEESGLTRVAQDGAWDRWGRYLSHGAQGKAEGVRRTS